MSRVLLGSLIALVLAATGCGGDDTAAPDPSTTESSASSTASSSGSASADPTPSDAATTSAAPTGPAPATGATVVSPYAQVQAPAGWKTDPTRTSTGGSVTGPTVVYSLSLVDAAISLDGSTAALAELSQKSCCYRPPLERQPDTTLGGQPAYHLAGNENFFGGWADEYGIYYQGHLIKVIVSTPRTIKPEKREAINASILASFQLTR